MENDNDTSIGTPYDDVFRTLITDSDLLAVTLLNGMFGLDLDPATRFIRYHNEVYLEDNSKRVSDSHMEAKGSKRFYHVECESVAGDSSILVRLFEYDSAIALAHATFKNNSLYVTFPKTGVLFLRDDKSTPDRMKMTVKAPDSDQLLSLNVAVMKISSYSLEEMLDKKLWFLLPFFIFTYEKQLKNDYDSTVDKEILEKLKLIKQNLDELTKTENIDVYTRRLLEQMTEKTVSALARKHENVVKGVESIMGGQVLDYEEKRILNRGIEQGRAEGRAEGQSVGQQILISRMLEKGTSVEMIHELTDIPTATIYSIQENRMNPSVVCEPDAGYVAGNN